MAEVKLSKTGLRTHTNGDAPSLWTAGQKAGFETLEDRIGLTFDGNPDGLIEGNWYGQTCWDLEGGVMYECTKPGSAGVATWTIRSGLPTGSVVGGLWDLLPAGFLPFDGVVRVRTDFPALFAVLPATMKVGDNFTLPLINTATGMLFGMGGAGNVGTVVGSFTSDEHTLTEAHMGSKLDASPVREASAETSSGSRRLARVVPETDTAPFENPTPFTLTFSPRRLKLLVGIKF
jgi:hypothetical protein